MRRHRSKKSKTVTNNLQTSDEKVTSEEKVNIDELPLDLFIEILGRLPVKSVVRFLTVSKLWEKTIHTREFMTSFPTGSSSQPRTLIGSVLEHSSFASSFENRGDQDVYFFTRSSSPETSFISCLTCPSPYPNTIEYHYHYVNGLISHGYGQEQIITNPSTGKFIDLPKVKTRRRVVKSYFGYDSVNDQYKVLSMTEKMHGREKEASSEHQVLTLGDKSWKILTCNIPNHRPWSNGVCIDGVVYYVAKTGEGMSHMRLMRFDVRFNKLDLFTSLPQEIQKPSQYSHFTLITYQGKIALPIATNSYTFDVWIIDQDAAKHEWLKKITISLEIWKHWYDRSLRIRGSTNTGEFILAPTHYYNKFFVVYYNPDTSCFRNVKIAVSDWNAFRNYSKRALVFSDYVESVRLL